MVDFNGKAFCFTGSMSSMKRAEAEQSVRARGGMTSNHVNAQLDYLVIGSIPSPQWKFGKYGSKIAAATELRSQGRGPQVISEDEYLTALAETPPTNSGEITAKIVVVTFKFTGDPSQDDWTPMDATLKHLRDDHGCHVSLTSFPIAMAIDIFGEQLTPLDMGLRVHCRIVRVMDVNEPAEPWANAVQADFSRVPWLRDQKLSWFERSEGTAGFIRLIRALPSNLDIPVY